MPRAEGYKQFLSPSEGLITEQTLLNPVENSTTDELNMTFSPNGSKRIRRLGLAPEEGSLPFSLGEAVSADSALSYHLWKSAGGVGDLDFHVFQINNTLYMIRDTSGNLSNQAVILTYDLDNNVSSAYTTTEDTPVDMDSGEGLLFIVGKKIEPFFLSYEDDVLTSVPVNIRIRDMVGVDDGLAVDTRPDGLDDEHEYNLHNQGWWQQRKRISDGAEVDPIVQFNTDVGDYPSNADIAYLGMTDDGNGNLRFDAVFIEDLSLGNTPAPKGHFIIDPFNIDYTGLLAGSTSGSGGWGTGASTAFADTYDATTTIFPGWYNEPTFTSYVPDTDPTERPE